jgi:hypothetical protein
MRGSQLALATLAGMLSSAGCGGDDTYIIVTVDRRAAVHDVTKLAITLSNAGSMRTDSLDMRDKEFPVTFSVSAPGRTGALGIAIDGLDGDDVLQGRGASTTTTDADTAAVMLDSADFVVNALYAGNQFLSNDFEAVGLQLAALGNGTWTTAFREDCNPCNIIARRFSSQGKPVDSVLAAGDTQFNVSTTLTTAGAIPAVASTPTTTLIVWDFFDTVGTGQGVACRALNETGGGTPGQLTLSTDSADVVTASPLSNGNFVVTWQSFITSMQVIRSVIVKPDCTTLAAPITVSTTSGMFGARRSHAASNGASVLYAWVVDGSVHMRYGTNAGPLTGTESTPIAATAALEVDHVRLAPWGSGFVAAVRWGAPNGMGPGKLEVYRIPATGGSPVTMGTPVLITDKSGSDFASDKAFAVAERGDGALMVAWHMCTAGAGTCDVFGRILRPTGVPVGEELVLATTTGSDQINPSLAALDNTSFVAAWNDSSTAPPDPAGSAVRARILYPVYDDARGILGATCGASAPGAPDCGAGLACAMGSDSVQRCYQTCTPPSCPGGGTCSTVDTITSACTF